MLPTELVGGEGRTHVGVDGESGGKGTWESQVYERVRIKRRLRKITAKLKIDAQTVRKRPPSERFGEQKPLVKREKTEQ